MAQIFLEGLLLQASLIMALGAQNLFVLESGLRRNHHITISFVCYFCDFILIMLGVAGAASLFHHFPHIKVIVGVIGIGFLFWYGFSKLTSRQDFNPGDMINDKSLKKSILKAMTFSLINPHAYLDGIVLIGGYSIKYPVLEQRLMLGVGASTCSLLWFLLLSSASSTLMPIFQNPRRMRVVMGTAGLFLILLSARLSMDVYGWFEELMYTETPSVAIDPSVTSAP